MALLFEFIPPQCQQQRIKSGNNDKVFSLAKLLYFRYL